MNKKGRAIPKTVDEAIDTVCDALTDEDKYQIKAGQVTIPQVHQTLGLHLRNMWHMWNDQSPLVHDFRVRFRLYGHGDDICAAILRGVWARIKGHDPLFAVWVDEVEQRWRDLGKNPHTGEDLQG